MRNLPRFHHANTENMQQIELSGSYTAVTTLSGEEIRITTTRKDPVPVLCRELVTRGVDPGEPVRVTIGGVPMWKADRTIGAWAEIDVTEYDRDGLRTEKHRPFPAGRMIS
jgi:hypothetical protein